MTNLFQLICFYAHVLANIAILVQIFMILQKFLQPEVIHALCVLDPIQHMRGFQIFVHQGFHLPKLTERKKKTLFGQSFIITAA